MSESAASVHAGLFEPSIHRPKDHQRGRQRRRGRERRVIRSTVEAMLDSLTNVDDRGIRMASHFEVRDVPPRRRLQVVVRRSHDSHDVALVVEDLRACRHIAHLAGRQSSQNAANARGHNSAHGHMSRRGTGLRQPTETKTARTNPWRDAIRSRCPYAATRVSCCRAPARG